MVRHKKYSKITRMVAFSVWALLVVLQGLTATLPSVHAQSSPYLRDFEIEANYFRQALPGSDNLLDFLLNSFRSQVPQQQIDFNQVFPSGSGSFINNSQNVGTANSIYQPTFTRYINAKPQKVYTPLNPIDLIQRPKLIDTTSTLRPIKVDALALYVGQPGDIITLFGRNLPEDKPTRVYINDVYRSNLEGVTASGTLASFKVPDLAVGAYELYLKTDRHKSNTTPFFIESENATTTARFKPHIDSIFPSTITDNGLVTIRGRNFTADKNALVTTFGLMYDLNSHTDGTVLTFYLDLEELHRLKKIPESFSIPLYFQVVNKNGSGNVYSGVSLD